jgi:tRNA pseudouridine32 synthase/23S rRNA pseudouridine746 synthase
MIVHRLDMATSGIVVMGRGAYYQRELSVLFHDRKVKKHYQALVDGQLPLGAEGEINLPIAADWPNRPRQKVDLIAGRASLTGYRVISVDRQTKSSRLELVPVTGRTHQLRVHMESAGHPILGDELYGTEQSRAKANRLMLHASLIEFVNPATGCLLSVVSAPNF